MTDNEAAAVAAVILGILVLAIAVLAARGILGNWDWLLGRQEEPQKESAS